MFRSEHVMPPVRGLLVVGVLASSAVGCGWSPPGQPSEVPAKTMEFRPLFDQHCRGCHGADGRMGPAPPLNDPLFLTIITDEQLREVITKGRQHTLMPSFGGKLPDDPARLALGPVVERGLLTDGQIDVLVKGLRSTWGKTPEPNAPPLPSYLSGKELDAALAKADSKHGRQVFATACATCHGTDGLGRTADGKPSTAGPLQQTAFLELTSDAVLRRIIITGRPDLKMPDFRKGDGRPLTEEQINDLAALLASWRKRDAVAGR
jgi:mono/diheme cytochrome c family protein